MSILDQSMRLAAAMHRTRARDWNTWDTRSVLRHVLLPESLAIDIGIAAPDRLIWVGESFFGQQQLPRTAGTQLTSIGRDLNISSILEIRPGPRSYDGAYTSLELDLRGARYRVETTASNGQWVALITPLQEVTWPRAVTVHARMLWNRPGHASRVDARTLVADLPGQEITIHVTGEPFHDPNLPTPSPYLAIQGDQPVAISTSTPLSLDEVTRRIADARTHLDKWNAEHDDQAETQEATRACIAWNLIYEPRFDRVICPVARDWNCKRGGYALFCWDSFLTAWMITADDPDLGYACAIETFREMVDESFIPNVAQGSGRVSCDRSQPPVGSLCLLGMYRLHPNQEVIESLWPALMAWNRWWDSDRQNTNGTISLGSNPYTPRVGDPAEFIQPNTGDGAAIESGLDNAPMYDDPPFDPDTHLMLIEDVGMTSLYVADCQAMAELALILGHQQDADELLGRAERYGQALENLWNDQEGIYLNRRTDKQEWSKARSPTSFYPLIGGYVPKDRAERLVSEHLLEPTQFAGEWMIPVSPKHEEAFKEQLYQRGRVWPPVNFLVYLGLHRYPLDKARHTLVEKSLALLLKGWREQGVVAETYSAIDGTGGRGPHTHPLYSWGPVLGFMSRIERGQIPSPFGPAGEHAGRSHS
ncbi:MAG: trehalase family glycosidase [Phycisphaeraceae bacterium]